MNLFGRQRNQTPHASDVDHLQLVRFIYRVIAPYASEHGSLGAFLVFKIQQQMNCIFDICLLAVLGSAKTLLANRGVRSLRTQQSYGLIWCILTRSFSKGFRLAGIFATIWSLRANPLPLFVSHTWALNSIMLWLTFSLTSNRLGL